MANSRSARKRIRSSERKHIRNRAVKSAVRTKVIKARHALLEEGGATGEAELHAAIKALDRAAEKGVLHRNNARRRKSRLASMAARLANVAEGVEGAAGEGGDFVVGEDAGWWVDEQEVSGGEEESKEGGQRGEGEGLGALHFDG